VRLARSSLFAVRTRLRQAASARQSLIGVFLESLLIQGPRRSWGVGIGRGFERCREPHLNLGAWKPHSGPYNQVKPEAMNAANPWSAVPTRAAAERAISKQPRPSPLGPKPEYKQETARHSKRSLIIPPRLGPDGRTLVHCSMASTPCNHQLQVSCPIPKEDNPIRVPAIPDQTSRMDTPQRTALITA